MSYYKSSLGPKLGTSYGNKLRNASDEMGGLAQWLGRKLKNHHPMSSVDTKKVGSPSTPKEVGIIASRQDTVLYRLNNERVFEITIREVVGDEQILDVLQEPLIKIGG